MNAREMSEAEAAKLLAGAPVDDGDGAGDDGEDDGMASRMESRVDEAVAEALPEWVTLPPGLKIPPGKKVCAVKLRAGWTESPWKGDRVVVCWPLSEREEVIALERAGGSGSKSIAELTKMSIRVIDGVKVDWSGKVPAGSVPTFWGEIGTACRQILQSYYLKTHTLTGEQLQDFFDNCIVVRTSVPVDV